MPHHVVVDGSNLATEGRTQPSLKQLNEAVLAYMEEDPTALITVVVDATFGHRIDAKEVAEFDEAVSNNELVAPPAGAIGRGDAFVLSIANKVNANILTNDSYQEFHGQYDWLFDEGRLIGGKPVPHIGWVFVNRLPVRGPLSRKAFSEAKRKGGPVGPVNTGRSRGGRSKAADEGTVRVGSPEANMPMPVPKAPPPGRAVAAALAAEAKPVATKAGRRGRGGSAAAVATGAAAPAAVASAPAAGQHAPRSTVNELLTFLTFVEKHPVGTSVNAIVDHYSSHGAYVRLGEVVGYVPLRLMADPAPRSAREFMKVGESVTLVVDSFVPGKRSIDLAIPGVGSVVPLPEVAAKPAKAVGRRGKAKPVDEVEAGPRAAAVEGDGPQAKARRGRKPAAAAAAEAAAPVATAPRRGKKAAEPTADAQQTSGHRATRSPEAAGTAGPVTEPGAKRAGGRKAAPVKAAAKAADKPTRAAEATGTPAKPAAASAPAASAAQQPAAKKVTAAKAAPTKSDKPAKTVTAARPTKAAANDGAAKTGTAKSGTAKTGKAKTGTTPGTATAGTATAGTAKTGTATAGTAPASPAAAAKPRAAKAAAPARRGRAGG